MEPLIVAGITAVFILLFLWASRSNDQKQNQLSKEDTLRDRQSVRLSEDKLDNDCRVSERIEHQSEPTSSSTSELKQICLDTTNTSSARLEAGLYILKRQLSQDDLLDVVNNVVSAASDTSVDVERVCEAIEIIVKSRHLTLACRRESVRSICLHRWEIPVRIKQQQLSPLLGYADVAKVRDSVKKLESDCSLGYHSWQIYGTRIFQYRGSSYKSEMIVRCTKCGAEKIHVAVAPSRASMLPLPDNPKKPETDPPPDAA